MEEEISLSEQEIIDQMRRTLEERFARFKELRNGFERASEEEAEDMLEKLLELADDVNDIVCALNKRNPGPDDAKNLIGEVEDALNAFEDDVRDRLLLCLDEN